MTKFPFSMAKACCSTLCMKHLKLSTTHPPIAQRCRFEAKLSRVITSVTYKTVLEPCTANNKVFYLSYCGEISPLRDENLKTVSIETFDVQINPLQCLFRIKEVKAIAYQDRQKPFIE